MDVEREVRRLTAVLVEQHPVFADRTVERLVRRLFAEHTTAPVRTYLPILVQREAHRQLADLDRDFAPHQVRLAVPLETGRSLLTG